MSDEPVVVVGAGFVPMIPGTWANTTIQPSQAEPAPIIAEIEAAPSPEPSPPQKSLSSKSSSSPKAAPGA